MKKLEIEHLSPYLPYGLKVIWKTDARYNVENLTAELTIADYDFLINKRKAKPILRPLSDYQDILLGRFKETNWDMHNDIEIVDFANKDIGLHGLSYGSYKCLISDHADVFDLISEGLAIDINTLEQ